MGHNVEIRENDIDSTQSNKTAQYLGTSYSAHSSNKSNTSNRSNSDFAQPFNPNALRPPKLSANGMDALYKSLRAHFTALAVKADCNQVSVTFHIQSMDEQLAIHRSNMIDAEFTTNQLQKTISSMHALSDSIKSISDNLHDAVEQLNTLWQLLPSSSPRSLACFDSNTKQRRQIMEGAMIRLGTYLKGSRQRWVVLHVDGLMAYYDANKIELKGVIDLMQATEVIPSDISHLMITVKINKNGKEKLKSWHFKCPSPQWVTKWLDAIRSLHF